MAWNWTPASRRVVAQLHRQTRHHQYAIRPLISTRASGRLYSSEAPPPPLLVKLKGDLKTAMKAKDAPRLTVLRSVLSATLNASKTASPIKTDAQLVALLRKTARASQDAMEEFRGAGREDLAEKEQAQIRVLDEYVSGSGIESVSEEDLKSWARATISELVAEGVDQKARMGEAMKRMFAAGGPLDGKDVNKAEAVKIIKEASTNA